MSKAKSVIDAPQITHTTAQHTAIIHVTCPRSEIQNVMGPGIGELMAAIGAQGIAPAGSLFTHHLRMNPETFDFEISVPVARPVKAAGRVKPSQWPAMKVARTVYCGPYEGLGDAWCEFGTWIETKGLSPAEDLWECYLTGPESGSDSSKWSTQLNRPLTA